MKILSVILEMKHADNQKATAFLLGTWCKAAMKRHRNGVT